MKCMVPAKKRVAVHLTTLSSFIPIALFRLLFPGLCLAVAVLAGTPTVAIRYHLEQPGKVSLAVYNPSDGAMLRTLMAGKDQVPGEYSVLWDGLDSNGEPVALGDYEWRLLRTPGFKAEYAFRLGTNPPDDPAASWPGNHGGVSGVAADESGLYLGALHSEALPTYIKLSPDYQRRLWEKHQYIAGGNGSKRMIVSDGILYNDKTDARLQVIDSADGRLIRMIDIAWDKTLETRADRHAHGKYLTVGVAAGIAVVGYPEQEQLRWYDTGSGEIIKTMAFQGLQAVGMSTNGTVFVASYSNLVELADNGKMHRVLTADLSNPQVIEVDSWNDELLVVEGAPSHQIKRFSRNGNLLRVYGTDGGRICEGMYDRPLPMEVLRMDPCFKGNQRIKEKTKNERETNE